jgi:hypothetical protein
MKWDSSVSKVSGYGAGQVGFNSQQGEGFFSFLDQLWGIPSFLFIFCMSTGGIFPWGLDSQGTKLTHLHLIPKLRMHGALFPCCHTCS